MDGFSESLGQIANDRVSSESELEPSDDSDSDGSSDSSDEENEEIGEDSIVELFTKTDLDVSLFPGTIKHLREMKDFFQSDINFKRRGSKMSEVTWSKAVERIAIFLVYCARNLNLDLCLVELVDDMTVVESFIRLIKRYRRVKSNTATLYVSSLITASKFLHANERGQNFDAAGSISDLCALQNRLNKEHAVLESARGAKNTRLFWPQFQELTRSLHQKYEAEADSKEKARLHMQFTLLLLFAINPGRAKQFRTLRIA